MDDDPQSFTEDFPEMSEMDRDSPSPTVEDEVKVDSIVQEELANWLDVSRSLRQFGLQPNFDKIKAAPEALPFLVLTTSQSQSLRAVVQTLMTDCDRRQALLQDIITVNNEMKSEIKRQTEVAQRYERKAKDLKVMLESSRQRLQEISEEKMLSQNVSNVEADRQRNTKEVAMTKVRQLEKRCEQQEEEILRLRRKVSKMAQEDSDRQERQRELFHRLKRRPASKKPSPLDDKVLDIIDSYERQVQSLRRERDLLGGGEDVIEEDEQDKERSVSVNYQKLVKDLQKKLKSATDAVSALEEEKELLKLDLDSRPSVRDFNNSQVRLRRYEKLLRQNNIDVRAEVRSDRSGRPPVFSTEVADLDFLPLPQCRDLLRAVSQELDVSNLDSLVLTAKELRRASRQMPYLDDFLRSVEKLVNSPSAPPLSVAFTSARREEEELELDSPKSSSRDEPSPQHRHLLSVLEFWLDQLSALPELRASLLRFYSHLFPWRSQPPDVGPEVCAMVGLVDSMMERESDVIQAKETCPHNVAQGLVAHFQRLFDCPRLSAVYTRINDVYAKLGELRTLFANIRQTLDLDPNTSPAQVFDAVTSLRRAQVDASEFELRRTLGADNLAKALEKLEQYDDFFPTFRKLVDDLLHLLELDHIDRILPAVRSLKHCVDLQ